MNEYNVKYYDKINYPIWLGIIIGLLTLPIEGSVLYIIADSKTLNYKDKIFFTLCIIFIFVGTIVFLVFYLVKKYQEKKEKLMHIIINEEYININNGEKYIYFNTIFGLNLEDKMMYNQGMHIKYAMELFILHNTSDEFKLGIVIGDKKNEEIFYEFYNEVKKRYENTKNII
jgi:hypothetical protein